MDEATAPTSTLERLLGGYMSLRTLQLNERLATAQTSQTALRNTVQQPTQPNANPTPAIASASATAAGVAGVPWLWIALALVVVLGVVVALRKG